MNALGGFYPYQRRWLDDGSRFKIGLWSRQSGKDFTCAAEAVMDCMAHPRRTWLVLACGERQALESLAKAKEWAELAKIELPPVTEKRRGSEMLMKSAEIRWPNGSRLMALPAKPGTIRGYSANLILTEFAFHESAEEVWRAIYPTISNPLRGGAKKVRIISTPNGQGNQFHQLWTQGEYSRHKVTIGEACNEGLPLNAEDLRRGLNNAEAWAQEYECEFIDQSSVLLPYELIGSCESAEATETNTLDGLSRCAGQLFAGIDFGRKQDLTVCWMLERTGNELWTREVLVLEKSSTPEQYAALRPRLGRVRRVALDYTGAGVGLGDQISREFGEWRPEQHLRGKIELCHFTQGLKMELFPRLRAALERGQLRIPVSRAIREDLHGVHRVVSQSGNVSYRASHSADGHSDRCTALALALHAAESGPASSGVTVVNVGQSVFRGMPKGMRIA